MKLWLVFLTLVHFCCNCSCCGSSGSRSSGIFRGESKRDKSKLPPSRFATNSTPIALNVSLYCESATLTGRWEYGANESTDFSLCETDADFFGKEKVAVRRQMKSYACPSYRGATYVPTSDCSLLSSAESLNILKYNMRPGSFVFVGDSLMMQQVSQSTRINVCMLLPS
jgi:hypothetical protein